MPSIGPTVLGARARLLIENATALPVGVFRWRMRAATRKGRAANLALLFSISAAKSTVTKDSMDETVACSVPLTLNDCRAVHALLNAKFQAIK